MTNKKAYCQLSFYVPKIHLEKVKNALFEAGAGHVGDYKKCAWQTKGTGQFMPIDNAQPAIGEINKLELIDEYKVEMIFEESLKLCIIETLKKSHPYEEVALNIIKLESHG